MFKMGSRVAAYWYDGRFAGEIIELEKIGAKIRFDSGQVRRCHFKQMRLLKPKKRREFWIRRHGEACPRTALCGESPLTAGVCKLCLATEVIHVREVIAAQKATS